MADQKIEHETRALAALYQCCSQIIRIANTGFWDDHAAAAMIRAIGVTDPRTVDDIYSVDQLKTGYEFTAKILSMNGIASIASNGDNDAVAILTLANKTMALAAQLTSRDKVYNELGSRIDTFHNRMVSEIPGFMDGDIQMVLRQDVLRECASIYQSLISPNFPRLMIPGQESCLRESDVQDKIRAMLLAAVRAYVLWEQLGASRLLLWFHRGRIVQCAQSHL